MVGLVSAGMVLLASAVHAQGTPPEVSFAVSREGEVIRTEARADFDFIPTARVWSVLTDYERYPRFITGMRESRVVLRKPDEVIVEQKGSFGILFFSRNIEARLRVSEVPPATIDSHALDGDFEIMDGHYEVRQFGKRTRVSFDGRLRPRFLLPPLIGLSITRSILLRNFNEMIDEIVRQDAQLRATRQHPMEE